MNFDLIKEKLNDFQKSLDIIKDVFNIVSLSEQLSKLKLEQQEPTFYSDLNRVQVVGKQISSLEKKIENGDNPSKIMRTFWAIVFILFPIALIFAENSLSSLQSVSIIAAFPIGIIIIMVAISFFKDAKKYLENK